MKLYLTLILGSLMATFSLGAQDLAQINQSTIVIDGQVHDSWRSVVEPEAKEVKKAWKDYLEDAYQTDVDGIGLFANQDVLSAEDSKFPTVTDGNSDLFLKVERESNNTIINLYGRDQQNNYWSHKDNSPQSQGMKEILTGFLQNYLTSYHQESTAESREKLNDLTKQRQNLIEDISKNEEDILKMEEQITKLKNENIELQRSLEKADTDLEAAKKDLDTKQKKFSAIRSLFKVSN